MKNLFFGSIFLLIVANFAAAQTAVLTPEDLKLFEGEKWTGTLTYLDYSSNKNTSIKSNLIVTRKADKPATWTFTYEYPDEPKANDSSDASLTDGGAKFFGENVVENVYDGNKELRLVTTQPGTDNGKKALFKYTYRVGAKTLNIKKEVQIEGTSEWFLRNEYSWTR
jgi:hypothetical protein